MTLALETPRDKSKAPMERLSTALSDELAAVDSMLNTHMHSSTDLIPQVAAHLVKAGGKRVRPVLTLAAANLCGYEGDHHIRLAEAVSLSIRRRFFTMTWLTAAPCDGASPPPTPSLGTSRASLLVTFCSVARFN